jgi:hypothetical protein
MKIPRGIAHAVELALLRHCLLLIRIDKERAHGEKYGNRGGWEGNGLFKKE